jgi:mannose-1-phosphate guanylyltransferase
MEAIFLVGGKGTRLLPLTLDTPKPMLKLGGVPFVEHQIGYAREHGVQRIIMAISYKNEQFLEFLGDGSKFGVEIVHALEREPLGTGGAIRNAGSYLTSASAEPIAILNGDILSAHDMSAQVAIHQEMNTDATLHLIEVPDARPYGSVPTDSSGKILEFVEKSAAPPTNFINAGCYIFTRKLIDEIPADRVVSVERETFPQLLTAGKVMMAYKSASYWIDIGTPTAFLKATTDLVTGEFHSPVFRVTEKKVFLDPRAQIGVGAKISEGSSIGASTLGANCIVTASVIGDGVVVGQGAEISASIIGNGAHIGEGSYLHGVILGGEGAKLSANSRQIGDSK